MIIRALLFYSLLAPLGDRYSVDHLIRRHAEMQKTIIHSDGRPPCRAAWPLRLMQINVVLIYAFSLPHTLLSDSSWLNGEALYWVFMSSLWNRWPVQGIFYNGILSSLMTYSTALIEGLFPILVWIPKTRLPILIAITLFHLGIALFLNNLTFFSLAMICSFALFIPGQKLASLVGKPQIPWRMK